MSSKVELLVISSFLSLQGLYAKKGWMVNKFTQENRYYAIKGDNKASKLDKRWLLWGMILKRIEIWADYSF